VPPMLRGAPPPRPLSNGTKAYRYPSPQGNNTLIFEFEIPHSVPQQQQKALLIPYRALGFSTIIIIIITHSAANRLYNYRLCCNSLPQYFAVTPHTILLPCCYCLLYERPKQLLYNSNNNNNSNSKQYHVVQATFHSDDIVGRRIGHESFKVGGVVRLQLPRRGR
jgi:hypothetical protein